MSTSQDSLVSSRKTYTRLTGGTYLRSQIAVSTFFDEFNEKTNSQNINVSFQEDTDLPFDEAA